MKDACCEMSQLLLFSCESNGVITAGVYKYIKLEMHVKGRRSRVDVGKLRNS